MYYIRLLLYDLVMVSLGRVLLLIGFDCVSAPVQFVLLPNWIYFVEVTVTKKQSNSQTIIEYSGSADIFINENVWKTIRKRFINAVFWNAIVIFRNV